MKRYWSYGKQKAEYCNKCYVGVKKIAENSHKKANDYGCSLWCFPFGEIDSSLIVTGM